MSKFLITGITGFVGASLCKRLRQDGHMLTGTTRTADLGAGPERVPLYHIPKVGPDTNWTQAVTGADIVVHLAARVHVMKEHATDPLAEFRNVNTAGTKRLAEQAAEAGVKRFVFLSSVKVNGEVSPETGFTETNPPQPEDAYGISKWEAEQALTEISKTTSMEVVVLRPPLVYGPGVKGNFISLMKAVNRSALLPLGAIQNRRSFIYVDNLSDAIAIAATRSEAANQTFLVSDETPLSTPSLIEAMAAALGKNPRLIRLPVGLLRLVGVLTGKSAAVNRLIGSLTIDTSHIRSCLGWKPPHSMEDGMGETAKWLV